MPSHTESRVLPYTADQLFDLVMDIESYPEFLPWCTGARVTSRRKGVIEAEVIIGYGLLREKFSSRVHASRPKSIEVEYMRGPMRHLHNKWAFKNLKDGKCRVGFYVDFSMKSRLLESLADRFFHLVLARMVDAFEKRAQKIYK